MNQSKPASAPEIGLDSQCLSYLLDGLTAVAAPADSLAPLKLALARIYFYTPGTLWVTPRVEVECARIRQAERRAMHASWISALYGVRSVSNAELVEQRTAQLAQLHADADDCRILAEAEDIGFTVLLSNDGRFRKRLGVQTKTVSIASPESFWNELAIPTGANPAKVPHPSNPLAEQSWWRW